MSTRYTEKLGKKIVVPWLILQGYHVEDLDHKHRNSSQAVRERIGKNTGDFALEKDGKKSYAELKVEERYTGNIWVEDWADYLKSVGWLIYLKNAKHLLCYFLDTDTLFWLDWPRFKEWVLSNKERFEWRHQGKHPQRNDTTAYLVPISDIPSDLITKYAPQADLLPALSAAA